MENTTKEYQFKGTQGKWEFSTNPLNTLQDHHSTVWVNQKNNGSVLIGDISKSAGKEQADENIKVIVIAGNLAQKFDPETWETRLTQFEQMKTALEKISEIGNKTAEKIALKAIASLTENNEKQNEST